ncbi:NADPH2:quinone reductase [Agrobacterium vitis]|nr:NADPH2:quinone reductase [Agrobacterium vitis]
MMNEVMEFDMPGEAEVLTLANRPLAALNPGEIRLRQTQIGVNFVDIYHRQGLYPLPLPAVPGVEAVGIVEAVADDVRNLHPGDRVAYACLPAGSYASYRNLPASMAIPLPDSLDDRAIAGSFLRGLTAHMLLETVTSVKPGQTVLIHAAAGGLGLILTQWAKQKGATTIGTVSTTAKADLAVAHGLDHAIVYTESDFVAQTLHLTDGKGVDYVIDGIGADVLLASFAALKPFGMVASIGQTAGPVAAIDPKLLTNRGFMRPSILALTADKQAYRTAAEAWLTMLAAGMRLEDGHTYPLAEAAKAHQDMEQRRTTGPVRLSTDNA